MEQPQTPLASSTIALDGITSRHQQQHCFPSNCALDEFECENNEGCPSPSRLNATSDSASSSDVVGQAVAMELDNAFVNQDELNNNNNNNNNNDDEYIETALDASAAAASADSTLTSSSSSSSSSPSSPSSSSSSSHDQNADTHSQLSASYQATAVSSSLKKKGGLSDVITKLQSHQQQPNPSLISNSNHDEYIDCDTQSEKSDLASATLSSSSDGDTKHVAKSISAMTPPPPLPPPTTTTTHQRSQHQSEMDLFKLLERANLLSYLGAFKEQGGDDVDQLCEADELEFREICQLVGMLSKPLHMRRLRKAIDECKSAKEQLLQAATLKSTNRFFLSFFLCILAP